MRIKIPRSVFNYTLNKQIAIEKNKTICITNSEIVLTDTRKLLRIECENAMLNDKKLLLDYLALKKLVSPLAKLKKHNVLEFDVEILESNVDSNDYDDYYYEEKRDKKAISGKAKIKCLQNNNIAIFECFNSFYDYGDTIQSFYDKDNVAFKLDSNFLNLKKFKDYRFIKVETQGDKVLLKAGIAKNDCLAKKYSFGEILQYEYDKSEFKGKEIGEFEFVLWDDSLNGLSENEPLELLYNYNKDNAMQRISHFQQGKTQLIEILMTAR